MTDRRKIVITGGTGLLGQVLQDRLQDRFEIVIIGRQTSPYRWDGTTLGEWTKTIDGAFAVINLAGRTVDCRYNATNRRQILESRVNATRVVGEAISKAANPPKVWLNASSATLYPHSLDRDQTEDSELDPTGFSEDVCRQWEAALMAANTPQTRRVAMRITISFGPERGGATDILHRLVRLGLGGAQGPGDQVVSWIHTDDFARAIEWLLEHEDLSGPINMAAPNPLSNQAFMRLFRKAVGIPFGLPSPTPLLALGAIFLRTEPELILKSRRVVPARLLESGFEFRHPTWGAAVKDIVSRRP